MNTVSNGLGRTVVVIASTLLCGSTLMVAALGPGLAQAQPNAPTHQVAIAPQA